jgi:hypothetical protein
MSYEDGKKRICELLKIRPMTQSEIVKESGFSKRHVNRITNLLLFEKKILPSRPFKNPRYYTI